MRYRLATYRECKAHREWNTTCPACGRKGKFSPYIDTATMRPVDDRQCGRCSRLSNCAYHLPPRQLPRTEDFISRETEFAACRGRRQSREERESPASMNYTSHRSRKSHRSCIVENSQLPSGVYTRRSRQQGRSDLPFCEIREICERKKEEICERQNNQREQEIHYEKMHRACEQSQPWGSHFVTWLRTQFPREAVAAAIKRYRVGGTPDGATLWWQIDEQGRVRTGKAMQYNPVTGHRVKEGPLNSPRGGACKYHGGAPVNWAHRMRLYGAPTDLVVSQCLFGEHILETPSNSPSMGRTQTSSQNNLQEHPEGAPHRGGAVQRTEGGCGGGSLCLVESEKTALIMSILCPNRVWLATGGKANFKASMLWPLAGREVTLYPDADALTEWYARAMELNCTLETKMHVPTWYYDLMNHPEARSAGLDLADVMLNGQ